MVHQRQLWSGRPYMYMDFVTHIPQQQPCLEMRERLDKAVVQRYHPRCCVDKVRGGVSIPNLHSTSLTGEFSMGFFDLPVPTLSFDMHENPLWDVMGGLHQVHGSSTFPTDLQEAVGVHGQRRRRVPHVECFCLRQKCLEYRPTMIARPGSP